MSWEIMSGAPCIAGTRVTPDWIMGMFLRGKSVREIACEFVIRESRIEHALRYEYDLKASGKRRPRQRRPKD